METEERYIVPGLKRGLAILQAFSPEQPELTISDLARVAEITRSSAFRIVYTLENAGYLKKVRDSKKYRLGYKVLELGFGFLTGLDIMERATPYLRELSETVPASSHLTALDDKEVIYLATYQGKINFSSNVRVGTRFPAYATTTGRILLGELPEEILEQRYSGAVLKSYSHRTAKNYEDLVSVLNTDRNNGFSISWEHFEKGVCSIAAPVRDHTGKIVFAVSASAPTSSVEREHFESVIRDKVMETGHQISAAMGFSASG